MAQMSKFIDEAIKIRCLNLGFKNSGIHYYKKINDEITYGMVFGGRSFGDVRLKSVGIQVRLNSLCDLYCNLMEYSVTKYTKAMPVIAVDLGYLLPNNTKMDTPKEWEFDKNTNVNARCDEIFQVIVNYGIPFMEAMSDIDKIIDVYESRKYPTIVQQVRYPMLSLMYYMKGDVFKSREMIEVMKNNKSLFPDTNLQVKNFISEFQLLLEKE